MTIVKRISAAFVAIAMAATMSFGAAAASSQTAYADITDGTSQSIDVLVDGEYVSTVNLDSLEAYEQETGTTIIRNESIGYLYLMGDETEHSWHVAKPADYVTLEDFFKSIDPSIEALWASGASLEFTTYNYDKTTQTYYEGVYSKWPNFTYDFINDSANPQTKFYGDTTQTDAGKTVTATNPSSIIAFNYATKMIGEDLGDTDADKTLEHLSVTGNPNTRFMMGLNSNTIDLPAGQGDNMGKRFPSSITKINIKTGANEAIAIN